MPPLTADRNTARRDDELYSRPVAAGVRIFAGALVALNATGFATPGATATDLTADGRAEESVDNTGGADGDVSVTVRKGVFRFNNSAGADEITAAAVGEPAYIVDDETVALTDGTATRSVAGTVTGVDGDGVWVRIA